jgi:Uncharacterized Fe-S protein
MSTLNGLIINGIESYVASSACAGKCRTPLVGFAAADNPFIRDLKNIANPDHYLPTDILPNAKTIVAFFVPFTPDIVQSNSNGSITSPEWAQGKVDIQKLINELASAMKVKLAGIGINCSENPAKEPYDSQKFAHRWSLRHIAYACGLGTFGLNQLLITKSGCAGRFGSFVIDAQTEYNTILQEEYCLYKINKSCGLCVKKCPTEALTYTGIDKPKCSQHINDITAKYFNGVREYRTCGKCITLPCALKNP